MLIPNSLILSMNWNYYSRIQVQN